MWTHRRLASAEGDTQASTQERSPQDAEPATEAPGHNQNPTTEELGQHQNPTTRAPSLTPQWKDTADENGEETWSSRDSRGPGGRSPGAFEKERGSLDAAAGTHVTVYVLPGTRTTRGLTSEVLSPGQALQMLEDAVAGNKSVGWRDWPEEWWPLVETALAVQEVVAVAVCGNGVGSSSETPFLHKAFFSSQDSLSAKRALFLHKVPSFA